MLLLFCGIFLFYLFNSFYSLFFIRGIFKIPYNNYKIKRIKYLINSENIKDLRTIALNSVGIIPNNPIFEGKNLDNKIVLIIYKNNEPIGLNIMFDYEFENKKCLHIGLVLIDKKHQGHKLQYFSKINIILYLIENIFKSIYISDIGRSASGLKIMNQSLKNSYPNLIYKTQPDNYSIKLSKYIFDNFKNDIQISPNATYDNENFIIHKSNDINGATYLVNDICESKKSSDERYNNYINNNIDILDEYLCIGKINILNIFF